jgi:hypothetical protein
VAGLSVKVTRLTLGSLVSCHGAIATSTFAVGDPESGSWLGITCFLERHLRLTVDTEKSAVDRPWRRSFLGYSMTWHKQVRLRIAPKSLKAFMTKL